MQTVRIIHFSDLLCIWAYIAEIRMHELEMAFGDRVAIDYRLFPVFGHAHAKLDKQWSERGGLPAYNEHVRSVAAQFPHLKVAPDIWLHTVPESSLPAHLHLYAVRLAQQAGLLPADAYAKTASHLRRAFFADARNIADRAVLRELLTELSMPLAKLDAIINDGRAWAALSEDMFQAKEMAIRFSPTLIFNEDRQRLTGNVGYRIIEANVRELLERPQSQHSWC